MIRRIEQDQAPYAVLTFQDVDTRIILFNLPEMAHIQAQDIADDGLVDGVMSGDEDRLAVVLPDVIIKGSAGADADIFQGFAALAWSPYVAVYASGGILQDTWLRFHRPASLPNRRG